MAARHIVTGCILGVITGLWLTDTRADTGVEPVIVCRAELPPADDLFAVTVPVAARWTGEPTGLRHADVMQPPRPRPDWIDGGGKPRPVTPTPVPLPGAVSLIGAGIAALGVLAGIRRMA